VPRPDSSPPGPERVAREINAIRRSPYGLRGFRRFARLLTLEGGQRFTIHPFQAFMLGFYFRGTTELVIILPKKNGKTTLLAALALYHLLMVESAECVIGAAAADQAAIMHRQAAGLVVRSNLQRRSAGRDRSHQGRMEYEGYFDVRGGIHEIRYGTGRIRVLPGDPKTADGVIPTLALVDELHRHVDAGLYGVFRDGLGPRGGQMITASTPGSSMSTPLGDLRAVALEWKREAAGKRRTYRTRRDDAVLIEWGLEPGDDPEDIELVMAANPAPWHTRKKLLQRKNSPLMTPWQWRRFACGLWTAVEEPIVDEKTWAELAVDIGAVRDGERVHVAVRSFALAGCGIGIVAARPDDAVAVRVETHPGDWATVQRALGSLVERYAVETIFVDPRQWGYGQDILEASGLPLEELPQTPVRFAEATSTFLGLVGAGKIMHDRDPVLSRQVMSMRMRETVSGEYVIPEAETNAVCALMLALVEATRPDPKPEIHVWQGLG
jgi:Terminase large subunit, ATPase domain